MPDLLPKACLRSNSVTKQQCPHFHVQLSIGLVLPTLLVWRAQLATARRLCQEDAPAGPHGESLQREFERSSYARLCQPALRAAGLAGWWLPLLVAALVGYQAGRLRSGGNVGAGD